MWLLIVGGKADVVAKAKALGLRVLLFQDRSRADGAELELADHVVLADLCRLDELVALAAAVRRSVPFERVVSLYEDTLIAAAEIQTALSLPGVPVDAVRTLKNKAAMRRRLAEVGLSPVLASPGETLNDVQAFWRHCRGPIVAKPIDESGSLGVFRVANDVAAAAAWEELAKGGHVPFLMEEYLEGPEVSVETFSFNGRHVVIGVTDKHVGPNFVEVGHTFPMRLDEAQQAELNELTASFLNVVGLTDGPSHTEIKLTPRGPRIVESHNRVGGDHINELVQASTGIDLKQLALAWACGLREQLPGPPRVRGAAAVRFLTPPPGVIESISGLDDVALAADVVACHLDVRLGDRIRSVRSSSDRSGFVVVRGQTAEQASNRAGELLRAIRIDTTRHQRGVAQTTEAPSRRP